ncbi:MAG: hypothetical protein Tsb0021_12710 [Chlamydiales bacterium]
MNRSRDWTWLPGACSCIEGTSRGDDGSIGPIELDINESPYLITKSNCFINYRNICLKYKLSYYYIIIFN